MINDRKARLLTILMYAFDEMNKEVGEHRDKLQMVVDELSDILNTTARTLRVDENDVLYGLLQKFSGVDSFNQAPTKDMLDLENYKMLNMVLQSCIVLVEDLKNEIEKVEK